MKEKDLLAMIVAFLNHKRSEALQVLQKIATELKMTGKDRLADQIKTLVMENTFITFDDPDDDNLIKLIYQSDLKLSLPSKIHPDQIEQHQISELQIHKILFLVYGEFYKKFKKPLFTDANFVAWTHGPVEIDYRQGFQKGLEQINKFHLNLNLEEKDYVKGLINKFLHFSVWSLVEICQSYDSWIYHYEQGLKNKIPNQAIWDDFS